LPKADQKPTRRFAGDLKYFFITPAKVRLENPASPARKSGLSVSAFFDETFLFS
jgi:hypothetical protein